MSNNLTIAEYKDFSIQSQINTFRKDVQLCIDYIARYRDSVERMPVSPDVQPGYLRKLLPVYPPEEPEEFRVILSDFDKCIMPGTRHWVHPANYANFPCGNSLINIPADMLSVAMGGVTFSWTSQPAGTELENIMMDWLGRILNLPQGMLFEESKGRGGGLIMSSEADCVFSVMTSARHIMLENLGSYKPTGEETGVHPGQFLPKFVCYTSSEAHSSVAKSAQLSLVDICIIEANENSQLTGLMLEREIEKDLAQGKTPFMVVATLGSTGGVCFDDLPSIGPIAQKYKLWLHVDGTYGGNALILPELQEQLRHGLDYADSFQVDAFAMLNAACEMSCLWLKSVHQYKKPWLINATYLIKQEDAEEMVKQNEIDYRNYGIALSHRMRATKLWFCLRTYGLTELQTQLRTMISLAKQFEQLVKADNRFEITNKPNLGVVCFRQRENESSRRNVRKRNSTFESSYCDLQNVNLQYRINKSRILYLVPTMLKGQYSLRLSVNYMYTTPDDIANAWKIIQGYYVNELDEEFRKTVDGEQKDASIIDSVQRNGYIKVIIQEPTLRSKLGHDLKEYNIKQVAVDPPTGNNFTSGINSQSISNFSSAFNSGDRNNSVLGPLFQF